MKIYLVTQNVQVGYDTHDAMVVIAVDEEAARKLHPDMEGEDQSWNMPLDHEWWKERQYSWAPSPEEVEVELLGEIQEECLPRVVLSSFNAG